VPSPAGPPHAAQELDSRPPCVADGPYIGRSPLPAMRCYLAGSQTGSTDDLERAWNDR